jgi:hypothetical protein
MKTSKNTKFNILKKISWENRHALRKKDKKFLGENKNSQKN